MTDVGARRQQPRPFSAPNRIDPDDVATGSGGGATEAFSPGQGAARVVRLIVGELDGRAIRELRDLLRRHASTPNTRLEIDLSQVDHQHPLTLFALLSDIQQRGKAEGTELVVLLPPAAMVARLSAVGLRIQHKPLMTPAKGTSIHVGGSTVGQA